MIMRTPFISLLALLAGISMENNLQAQTATGNIAGAIVEEQSGEAAIYATVMLYRQADTTLVKGDFSDENGAFRFESLENDTYFLQVTQVGLADLVIPDIQLKSSNATIDLGTLRMAEAAQQLAEPIETRPRTGQRVLLCQRHPPQMAIDLPEELDVDTAPDMAKVDEQTERRRNPNPGDGIRVPVGKSAIHLDGLPEYLQLTRQQPRGLCMDLLRISGARRALAPRSTPARVLCLFRHDVGSEKASALHQSAHHGARPVRHFLPVHAAEPS